jgi:hypothetical protein
MRLSYLWHDWRSRHLTGAEYRIQSLDALPVLPEADRMRTKPKPSINKRTPMTFAEWNQRYGGERKRA